ncbi:MAG: phage tail assembly chaperone [Alphaproteobacteria bacterium]|nr:phage tail assembly chaperone [Alphaproteobacteria bacterium]
MTEFRLAPSEAWALGLAEWRWLLEARESVAGLAPLRAAELRRLMQQYPDKEQ